MTTTPIDRPARPALGTLVQLQDLTPGQVARLRPKGAREDEWCEYTHHELGRPVFLRADGRTARLPNETQLSDWVRMLPVRPSEMPPDRGRASQVLGRNFPQCSFRVTSAQGGIEVAWTDGPSERTVAIALVEEGITTFWLYRWGSPGLYAARLVQLVLHGDWTGDDRDLWHMTGAETLSEDVIRLGVQLAAFAGESGSTDLYDTMKRVGIGVLAATCGMPDLAPHGTCGKCPGPAAFGARARMTSRTDNVCRRCITKYSNGKWELFVLDR